MNIVTVAAGALVANFITITILYSLWRLGRSERDGWAIAIGLAGFSAGAAIFLLGR